MARILLVDDESQVLSAVAGVLEAAGHEVIAVPDPRAALALVRERDPDLVIADFHMPGMSGAGLAVWCWAIRPDLPVLFISGMEIDDSFLDEMTGTAQFLHKPFDPDRLLELVGAMLPDAPS